MWILETVKRKIGGEGLSVAETLTVIAKMDMYPKLDPTTSQLTTHSPYSLMKTHQLTVILQIAIHLSRKAPIHGRNTDPKY